MSGEDLYVGLMVGTSLDGIDAVLVRIGQDEQDWIELVSSHCAALAEPLRKRLQDISLAKYDNIRDPIEELGVLNVEVGRHLAGAVGKLLGNAGFGAKEVRAIGSHGITIRHRPNLGFTMQIGDAAVLSVETGIDVVADMRVKDVALDGQGAPLAPGYHAFAYASKSTDRCVLNIGGISNVTILRRMDDGQSVAKVDAGFDVGPGNVLMDAWCKERTGDKFDNDGAWARGGNVHRGLLEVMLQEPYLRVKPPKSTGKELFNMDWLEKKLDGCKGGAPKDQDVQCTLAHFTAKCVAEAIKPFFEDTFEVIVCGGGAHNSFLLQLIKHYAEGEENMKCKSVAAARDGDWTEAMAFAWMAERFLNDKPANLPAVTGAQKAAILGSLYKAG